MDNQVWDRLTEVSLKALQGAFERAKQDGCKYLEVVHWLDALLRSQGTDLEPLLAGQGIATDQLLAELSEELEELAAGGGAVEGLADQMRTLLDRADQVATELGAPRIRSSHVILALLSLEGAFKRLLRRIPMLRQVQPAKVLETLSAGPLGTGEDPSEDADEGEAFSSDHGSRKEKQSYLQKFAVNMTDQARSGRLDIVVGRDSEIRQVCDVLLRRRQNNPILAGEPGVGKTAIVEGLARRIAMGDVPEALRDVQLWALDLTLLQAGAGVKGEFEARLKGVIDEVQSSPTPIVLFIDEAHTMIGAGGAAGTGDAANILKPALARGTLRTIAATTWSEYKQYFEKDPALTRRFQVVKVNEPTQEDAIMMLRVLSEELERHHRVEISDEAITHAVQWSVRYLPSRFLPDKAVSLLDTACARVSLAQGSEPQLIESLRRELWRLQEEAKILRSEHAFGASNAERRLETDGQIAQHMSEIDRISSRLTAERDAVSKVQELRTQVRELLRSAASDDGELAGLRSELETAKAAMQEIQGDSPLIPAFVDANVVGDVLSGWSGIPVRKMVRNDIEGVLGLESRLAERVVGQDHAHKAIANRIRISRAGLDNPDKPIGVFLLAGPSGVGKTETALALADTMYGGDQSLIVINMSEFKESHTVSTLKGAPPGYVGFEAGGVLTEAVRRRPYSVILLDEVEKAHKDVHEIFFQVFDKGWMEDGKGQRVDFKNTLILLTTNAGSDEIISAAHGNKATVEQLYNEIRPALRRVFPDALLGRMTVVPYYPLTDDLLARIAQMALDKITERLLREYGATLEVSPDVFEMIVARSKEVESGGRLVQAIISNSILPVLSSRVLNAQLSGKPIDSVKVVVSNGGFECVI